jgi:hypothetical protein
MRKVVARIFGSGGGSGAAVSTPPAAVADPATLVAGVQSEFDWESKAGRYVRVGDWSRSRSGSAFYHLRGEPEGPEVVLKTVSGWDAEDALDNYTALGALSDLVGDAGIRAAAPITPLGWSVEPPSVVLPYVEGEDLVSVLRRPDHPGWRHMSSWMESAGRLLAAFHAQDATSVDPTRGMSEITALASRYRIHVPSEAGIGEGLTGRSVPLYGDIGPGNLLGSPHGALHLLDPPVDPKNGLPHRDLANFIFETRRQLAGRGYTRSRPVKGRFDRLRAAFIEGYSAQSGQPIGQIDEALIAVYELRRSAGMARKRFPRRMGDAWWFGRQAVLRRREAIAGLTPQS